MTEPERLICAVEIPKGTRNKYEYDAELGGIVFDRLLMTPAHYPTDYGFLVGTLGQDGDPLDALVCLTEPTFPGCLIPVKPVGLFKMRDEAGVDDKVVCVPVSDPNWSEYERMEDLPALLREEIEQFFSIYKDLEGKTVDIDGWRSAADARAEIRESRLRARGASGAYGFTPNERLSMATGETGFDDVAYDLVSVQYHSLKAGHDYGQYVRDARNAGRDDIADFFGTVMSEDSERAAKCHEFLKDLPSKAKSGATAR